MINTPSATQFDFRTRITFFRSMLGQLILWFLAVSLIPLAIVGSVAITQLYIAKNAANEVSENYFPSIINLDNAELALMQIIKAQKNHIIAPDDATMRALETTIKTERQKLFNALAAFEMTLDEGTETYAFERFQIVLNAFLQDHEQVILLSQSNTDDEAQALSVGKANEKFEEAFHLMETMRETNIVGSKQAKMAADQAARMGVILTLVTSLIITIFVLIAAIGVANSISNPLVIVTKAVRNLATGNVNSTGIAPIEMEKILARQDELGEIGRAFDNLVIYFQTVIADIVQVSQGLAAGNLHILPQAEYRGDFVHIKKALETALSNQRQVIEDIVQISQKFADGNLNIMPQAEYRGDFIQIKKALEMAMDNQQRVIEDIVHFSQGLAAGNLQVKPQVEYRGDFIQIKTALEIAMDNQRQVIEDIVRVSQGLAEGNLSITPQSEYQGDFLHIKKAQEMALSNQRQVIKDIVQVSQSLADGHLHITSQAIYRGDFVQIKKALETALANLRQVIEDIVQVSQGLAEGSQDIMPQAEYRGDLSQIKQALESASAKLAETTTQNAQQDWLKTGHALLNEKLSGEQNLMTLSRQIISFLTTYVEAQVGLFYLLNEANSAQNQPDYLQTIANYGYTTQESTPQKFLLTDGLVGQATLEKKTILITQKSEECRPIIRSGLSGAIPHQVLVMPFLYENTVKGVIEIGFAEKVAERQQSFLQQAMPSIGIAINTAESRLKMQELLQQSQKQTEELQSQSEELRSQQEEMQQINEELQSQREELESKQVELQNQNEELQSQSEELQTQQEELKQTNEALEERTKELERQKAEVQHQNLTLEKTQAEMKQTQVILETKAHELELANHYKSEFLANMSHELRTPLNSLLILAQLLADNKPANLTDKQVEYAKTIHSAGSDLLTLINEILDLSKVEAGKIDVHHEEVSLSDLIETLEPKFRHQASEKGLDFQITLADNMPAHLYTDGQRLKQILNNLLSNAFKFTHQGEVRLEIERPKSPLPLQSGELSASEEKSPLTPLFQSGELQSSAVGPLSQKTTADSPLSQRGARGDFPIIAFRVTDTGIGIPKDKQQTIFEAFQQADGSTSRRYGGTGLGLSISRQLVRLLGGELHLHSEEGQGSTFTLYLPETHQRNIESETSTEKFSQTHVPIQKEPKNVPVEKNQPVASRESTTEIPRPEQMPTMIKDDRMTLNANDKSLLIIDDDDKFSSILMDLGHEKSFQCLLAEDGRTGLQLAEQYQPTAILLDVGLPQIDGWTVMEHLKDNPDTRHIPVHFISAAEQNRLQATKMGAIGFLSKPVNMKQLGEVFQKIEQFITNSLKNLLVIVDVEPHQQKILELVGSDNIQTTLAVTTVAALKHLKETWFDCIILDMDIEQGAGEQLLKQMQQTEHLCQIPVIVYIDRDLTPSEEALLLQCSDHLPIKAVRSSERLLDEATLFLHQVEANLPTQKRQMLRMVHDKEAILSQKKVLIVDDDVRNVFALATVLEEKQMEVMAGNNGNEALELLDKHQDIAIVLMDIMMPEMDGYEAMRQIRTQDRFRKLPIIALTAKAMKGDKAKCIEAGANDYLSKPVDTDKLISLMRVWLYR